MTTKLDVFKGTCQEFGKVFSEDLASLDAIDDKVQHHAEALTNCLKLVQSSPDSPSVQRLWTWLIRSAVNTLLFIDQPPSSQSLRLFVETIRPWLIDGNFSGLCHKELRDMCNLAMNGPWAHPVLQRLISGADVELQEIREVFDGGLECIEYRIRSLHLSTRINELVQFGTAALTHSKVKKNNAVQKVYQSCAYHVLNEVDLTKQIQYFDLDITITLMDELIKEDINCQKLCNAVIKYLWQNKIMDRLQEVTELWITLLRKLHPGAELFDFLTKNIIEAEASIQSVQQCVTVASALWKVVPEASRMMCVEILCHSLHLLSSDDPNCDQLKNGILSSIAYFLPNSQVARSCVLTIFIQNPSIDNYLKVSKTYKVPYDREKDIAANFKAHLRLSLLEYLHQQWSSQFLQSNSWDWPRLRALCYDNMAPEDVNYVQQVEREEENNAAEGDVEVPEKKTDEKVSQLTSSHQPVQPALRTPSVCKSSADGNDAAASDNNKGTSESCDGDSCDCVACGLKANATTIQSSKSTSPPPKKQTTHPDSTTVSVTEGGHLGDETTVTCPEESCRRVICSKAGMSRHLSRTHHWPLPEIHLFYASLEKEGLLPLSKPCKSDLATLKTDGKVYDARNDPGKEEPSSPPKITESSDNLNLTNSENLSLFDRIGQPVPLEPDQEPGQQPTSVVTPTLAPILPEIFATESATQDPPVVKQKELTKFQIKCPVSSCTRVFRHRHTIKAHIEFRHNINPAKAAKMAKEAAYVDDPNPVSSRGNDLTNRTDISRSRGWYWLVDDFIDEDVNGDGDSRGFKRKLDANLRSSVAQDIICTLGNAPLSYDLAAAEAYILSNWKFAARYSRAEKEVDEMLPPTATFTGTPTPAGEISFEDDTLPASPQFEFNHMEEEMQPPLPEPATPVTKSLSDVKPLLQVKVKLKASKTPPPPPELASANQITKHPPATKARILSATTNTRSIACQTKFKTTDFGFNEIDHYHNLPSVKSKKQPKSRINEKCPIAVTVLSGSMFGRPVCSQSSQCCLCDKRMLIKETMRHLNKKRADVVKKKRKSLESPLKSIPMFSSDSEESVTFATKQIKRKYDAQSVYNIADKCREVLIEAKAKTETSVGVGGVKPSFEDALNYAPTAPQTQEKPKPTRKRSLSKNKNEEHRADLKRSSSAHSAVPSGDSSPDQASKQKVKKRKSSRPRLPSVVKKSKLVDISIMDKKDEEDVKQLAPCQDYEELLKKAEELNSAASKPKTPKPPPPKTDFESVISKAATLKSSSVPSRQSSSEDKSDTVCSPVSESLVPPRVSPEKVKKKNRSSKGKRMISLRDLSSKNNQQNETSAFSCTEESIRPLDESMSAPSEQDSLCIPSASQEDATTVASLRNLEQSARSSPPPASSTLSTEVLCPECLKPMSSAFALTCHMRKRHKGHSKKMFFPGQTPDVHQSAPGSDKKEKKHKKKASKNEQGPPEGSEASSDNATPRLALIDSNASASSNSSLDNDHCHLHESTSDISFATERESCSKTLNSDENLPLSRIFPSLNDNLTSNQQRIVTSASNVIFTATVVSIKKAGDKSDPTVPLTTTPSIIQSANDNCVDTKPSLVAPNDAPSSKSPAPVNKSLSTEADTDEPISVNIVDGKFVCPLPRCPAKYSHRRSLVSHAKVKHPSIHSRLLRISQPRHHHGLETAVSKPTRCGGKMNEGASTDDKGTTVKHTERTPRRLAYTEANLQIQFFSGNSSSRKWAERQELAHLYTKRIRKKIAQSLSPARKKVKSLKSKLHLKRCRTESSDSTDSFETDYDAQLSCWSCDATFHRRKNLTKHIQHHLRHVDLCPFRCDQSGCLFGFRNADALSFHKSKHKPRNHICLFCPNQSRSFKSLRKIIIHEHIAHPHLQVNMATLRRTMCVVPPKWSQIYSEKNIAEEINAAKRCRMLDENTDEDSQLSDVDETVTGSSFLAPGHRRIAKQGDDCDACKEARPSVAEHCQCGRSITRSVARLIHDLTGTVEDYIWLHRKDTPFGTSLGHRGESESADLQHRLSIDLSLSINEDSPVDSVPPSHRKEKTLENETPSSHKTTVITDKGSDSQTENLEEIPPNAEQGCTNLTEAVKPSNDPECNIEKQNCDNTPFHNNTPDITVPPSKSQVEYCHDGTSPLASTQTLEISSSTSDKTIDAEVLSLLNDLLTSIPSQQVDAFVHEENIASVTELTLLSDGKITQTDADASLPATFYCDVYETLHKIVCDVEIEEQANYMRICGYVPTGVMYFKQCDLANEPGVGLSVFGYNCHAFLSMERSGHSADARPNTPTETLPPIMNTPQAHVNITETTQDAVLAGTHEQSPATLSNNFCHPFTATTTELVVGSTTENKELTLDSFKNEPQIAGVSSDIVPLSTSPVEGGLGSPDPNLSQAFIRSNFLSLYSLKFHPTWTLDADESYSDLCDISQIPPLSRKLFCQHFVVPSPTLNLPPAPLSGICAPFPVTSDYARSSAFSACYDVSYTAVNQNEGICQEETLHLQIKSHDEDAQHPQFSSLKKHSAGEEEEEHPRETSNDNNMDNPRIFKMKPQTLAADALLEVDDVTMSDASSKTLSSSLSSDENTETNCEISSSEEDKDCPPVLNAATDTSTSQTSHDVVPSGSPKHNESQVTEEPAKLKCNLECSLSLNCDLERTSAIVEVDPSERVACTDGVVNETPVEPAPDNVSSDALGTQLNKEDNLEDLAVHHFMEDLKAGLKERKPNQSDVLKPVNVFKGKGRFQLSLGIQNKVNKKRRNLSEIVAFCDGLTESEIDDMTEKAKRRMSIRAAYAKRKQMMMLKLGDKAPKKKQVRKNKVDPTSPKKLGRPRKNKEQKITSNQFNSNLRKDESTIGKIKLKLPKNKRLIPMVERLQTSAQVRKSSVGKTLVKSKLRKRTLRDVKKLSRKNKSKDPNTVAQSNEILPTRKTVKKRTAISTVPSYRPRDLPKRSCLLNVSFENKEMDEDTETAREDSSVSNDDEFGEYVPNSKEIRSARPCGKQKRRKFRRGSTTVNDNPAQPPLRLSPSSNYFGLGDYYKELHPDHPDQCTTAKQTANLLEKFSILTKPFRSFKPWDADSQPKSHPQCKTPPSNLSSPSNDQSAPHTTDLTSLSDCSTVKAPQPSGPIPKDICPVCRMVFCKRDKFLHHVNMQHVETKLPYRCTVLGILPFYFPWASRCLFSFNTKAELNEHGHRHHSPLPVYCIFCPLWFSSISICRQHIAIAHDRSASTSRTSSSQSKASTNNPPGQSTSVARTPQSYQGTFEQFIQRHSAQAIHGKLQDSPDHNQQPITSLSDSAPLVVEPSEDAIKDDDQESLPLAVSLSPNSTNNLQPIICSSSAKPEEISQLFSGSPPPVNDSCESTTVANCQEALSEEPTSQSSVVQLSTVVTSPIRFEAEPVSLPLSVTSQPHSDVNDKGVLQSRVKTGLNQSEAEPTSSLSTITSQSSPSCDEKAPVHSVLPNNGSSEKRLNDVIDITTSDETTETEDTRQHNGTDNVTCLPAVSKLSDDDCWSSHAESVSLANPLQTHSNSVNPDPAAIISIHKVAITKSCAVVQPTFRNTTPIAKTTGVDVRDLARIAGQTKAITDLVSSSSSHRHALVNVVSTSDKIVSTVLPISAHTLPLSHNVSSGLRTSVPSAAKLCSISISSLPRVQQTATVLLNKTPPVTSSDALSAPSVGGVTTLPKKLVLPNGPLSANQIARNLPTAVPTIITPRPSRSRVASFDHRPGAAPLVVTGLNRQLIKSSSSQSVSSTDRVVTSNCATVKKTVPPPPVFVTVCPPVTSVSTPSRSSSAPAPSIHVNIQVPVLTSDLSSVQKTQEMGSRIHPSFARSSLPALRKPSFHLLPIHQLPIPISSSITRKPDVLPSVKNLSNPISSLYAVDNKHDSLLNRQLSPVADVENKKTKLPEFSKVIRKVVHDPIPPAQRKKRKLFIDLDNLNYTDLSVVECDYCGNMYSNFYDYQAHMLKDHSLFLCGHANCNAVYGSEEMLFHHYHEDHRLTKPRESDDISVTSSDDDTDHRENQDVHDARSLTMAKNVWNKSIPIIPAKERFLLFAKIKELSTDQLLQILFQEVQAFTSRCRVFRSQNDEEWLRCPIHGGPVLGDKKALYFHMLEHRLSQIIDWLRTRLKRNSDRLQRLKQDDHDVPKESLHSHDVSHGDDDTCHQQSNDQECLHDDNSLNPIGDKKTVHSDASIETKATRKIYKCRFRNCKKRIRGESNFRRHMFDHSRADRIAWYEQGGEVWSLFRGTVPLSRCSVSSSAEPEARRMSEPTVTSPRTSPALPPQFSPKQSLTVTIHDVLRTPSKDFEENNVIRAGIPPSVLKLPPTGSPISPMVLLKKLTPPQGVHVERE